MGATTIKFYPNLLKKRSDSGETPVYLRLIVDGKKTEAKLPVYLNDNSLKSWLKDYRDPNSSLNLELSLYRKRFKDYITINSCHLNASALPQIRDYVLNIQKKEEKMLVKNFVSGFYTKSVLPSGDKTKGTKNNYLKAYNHFYRFLEFQGLSAIDVFC